MVTADLVVVSTNVGLIQGGIKNDAIVVNVDFHIGLFETFINAYVNVVRDCFLSVLLGLFDLAIAGLFAGILPLWRHCFIRMRNKTDQ